MHIILEAPHLATTHCSEVLGPEHPQTLASANNLAGCWYKAKKFHEAAEMHKATLEKRTRVLGPAHACRLLFYSLLFFSWFALCFAV